MGPLMKKLSAYGLAAGAVVGGATQAHAVITQYFGPWFDSCPEFGAGYYDMILLKLDGTVLVDDAAIDAAKAGGVGNAIEFVHNGTFVWGDGKSRDAMTAVAHGSAGIVSSYWSAVPEGRKLTDRVGFHDGPRVGSDTEYWASGQEVGLYGYGWFQSVGPWSGGGTGFVGIYIDDVDGRHYGWAEITLGSARNEITLHRFAFQMEPGAPIPEPATLSVLALGATGLLARRRQSRK